MTTRRPPGFLTEKLERAPRGARGGAPVRRSGAEVEGVGGRTFGPELEEEAERMIG